MSSFRFFHAADIHLDSPLRGLARRGEAAGAFLDASRRALENLVSAAITERVAFLVIAGDVYDGDWRDYATGQFFVRQMGRLTRASIPVYLISGNHDAESVITRSLPLPPNVHSFPGRAVKTELIEDLRVALHGWGFANRQVPENLAQRFPPAVPGHFNIGLLHTSLTGREGHAAYAPCTIDDLRRLSYNYWALGHVHEREIVAQDPWIVFPGNLQGRHAKETGPRGASLVTVVDGRVTGIEAVELDVVRFAHEMVDLAGIEARSEVTTRVRVAMARARAEADDRPLALRLTFVGRTALHASLLARGEQLREEMQALAWEAGADLLVEKVRVATIPAEAAALPELSGFAEVLDAIAGDSDFRDEIARTLNDLVAKAPAEALVASLAPDTKMAIEQAYASIIAALGDAPPEAGR